MFVVTLEDIYFVIGAATCLGSIGIVVIGVLGIAFVVGYNAKRNEEKREKWE